MAEEDKSEEQGSGSAGKQSMMKVILITVLFSFLLGSVAVGATVYLMGGSEDANGQEVTGEEGGEAEEAAEVDERPHLYLPLKQKFVVSFNDQSEARFMQFSLDISSRDQKVIEAVETNMSAIRSSLLMLFGSQPYENVASRAGKEQLLVEAADDINVTLHRLTGVSGVESAFFTSFVIQ